MKINLSERTNWPTELNAIHRALALKRQAGEKILDLSVANPTQCDFHYLGNELLGGFLSEENLHYEPQAKGLLGARQAISKYYRNKGVDVDPECIILTSSTSEAYTHLFNLLTNPGDTILVPKPGYPLFEYQQALSGIDLAPYFLQFGTRWSLSGEELDRCFHQAPKAKVLKALVVVHPNNPTGSYLSAAEMREVTRLCAARGCAIIADEVFHDYSAPNCQGAPVSFVSNNEVLTFTISGISKVLGLPQMKLSWIVVSGPSTEVTEAVARLEFLSDLYLSVSTPIQTSLADWLELCHDIQNEIRNRLLDNEQYLLSKVNAQTAGAWILREGGWSGVLRFPGDDEALALSLLQERNVLVQPGYWFDFSEDGYFVLSLLVEHEIFRSAVNQIFEAQR